MDDKQPSITTEHNMSVNEEGIVSGIKKIWWWYNICNCSADDNDVTNKFQKKYTKFTSDSVYDMTNKERAYVYWILPLHLYTLILSSMMLTGQFFSTMITCIIILMCGPNDILYSEFFALKMYSYLFFHNVIRLIFGIIISIFLFIYQGLNDKTNQNMNNT